MGGEGAAFCGEFLCDVGCDKDGLGSSLDWTGSAGLSVEEALGSPSMGERVGSETQTMITFQSQYKQNTFT